MQIRLKELRKAKGLTQSKLAKLTGLGRVNIVRFENGSRKLSAQNALKIVVALGCTVEDLFTRVDGEDELFGKPETESAE